MDDLERAEKAKAWDARTPAERFESLTREEKTAFRGFFRGASATLQISYRGDTGVVLPTSFGKAECEWVPIEFWKYKLTGLRLIEWKEDEPKIALGMTPGSVFICANITVTEDGFAAYDAAMESKGE